MRGATRHSRESTLPSIFQSTLPMRGATPRWTTFCQVKRNFNPHSPCGERRDVCPSGDGYYSFQSTLPMRGATRLIKSHITRSVISIHTPHAGSDLVIIIFIPIVQRFQSTLPMRGATYSSSIYVRFNKIFQSTLPMRGATGGNMC